MWDPEGVVILSGSGGTTLAEEIAGIIGLPASSCVSASSRVRGECQIRLGTNVRGRNVFVVQSTGHPVNDHVIELALILSACKRASAARVHAIVPYLAYGRQTRKTKSRVPVSAADVAAMLEEACVDAIVTVGVHDTQNAGFYSPRCAFHNMDYIPVATRFLVRHGLRSPVVVAPHASTVRMAMDVVRALLEYQSELGTYAASSSSVGCCTSQEGTGGQRMPSSTMPAHTQETIPAGTCPPASQSPCSAWTEPPTLAMLLTVERLGSKELELTGDVAGRDVVLVDDIIDTGNTLARSSRELIARGAARVFAIAVHGLFSQQDAADRLAKAPIDLLVVTNTLPTVTSQLPGDHRLRRKLVLLSIAPMLARYICEHADLPSPDFDPMVPTYAMHGGSTTAEPAFQRLLRRNMHCMSLEEDSLLSDGASVSESLTTASEF